MAIYEAARIGNHRGTTLDQSTKKKEVSSKGSFIVFQRKRIILY